LRVSFVAFVLALSIAVIHECGHHEARLFGGPRPGQATPLRSVPCGLAGLTGTAAPPAVRQLRDGRGYAQLGRQASGRGGSCGVMIRSRSRRNQRPRRVARQRAPRDHGDEMLLMLVRVLARQAARERFEREVAAERDTPPEVTLH
jgi:hypothetical protein